MTARPRRRTPSAGQRQRWDEQRAAKLADLHTLIVDHVATLTDGNAWRAWLQFATRFHTYSFGNTIAIWAQRPDATWVGGIKRWNSMGRHVREGEKGIAILAPITARAEPGSDKDPAPFNPDPSAGAASLGPAGQPGVVDLTGSAVTAFIEAKLASLDGDPTRPAARMLRGFKITHVWDIAQTEGPPIDPPTRPGRSDVDAQLLTGQAPAGVWDALVGLAVQRGYRVERGDCHGANGFVRFDDHLIKVRADVDDAQAVKTLIHELGHVLLHEPTDFLGGSTLRCQGEREVEAESVAFLVAAHAGLDTSDYTFGYVTIWAERAVQSTGKAPHEIVQATGTRVVGAAATLTAALDEALGHGDPPVPTELSQRVHAGTQKAAAARTAAHAAAAGAGLSDRPAAGRAFPHPTAAARSSTAPPPVAPPAPPAGPTRHR